MSRTAHWISTVALAAGLGVFQAYAEPGDTLPAPLQFGGISVISGGVDLAEAELFKQAAGRYPLRVVFSVRGGNYAVPEEFTVMQRGNVVLQIPSAGPWLLIDLPPGSYTLQARVENRMFERPVTVGRRGNTVHWVVPDGAG